MISPAEVEQHNEQDGSFWAVIDGYVVDATDFSATHPGGSTKLLSANEPETGATGRAFGFSFSRGYNAHFPATATRFRDGVERYLNGGIEQAAWHDGPFPLSQRDELCREHFAQRSEENWPCGRVAATAASRVPANGW